MRILLDTHALLWWLLEPKSLSRSARSAIETADGVFVSSVSAFEISTKVRLGKLEAARTIATDFAAMLDRERFLRLAITERDALAAGWLLGQHRDPFDRFLAAQAVNEGLPLFTRDPAFTEFGVATLW